MKLKHLKTGRIMMNSFVLIILLLIGSCLRTYGVQVNNEQNTISDPPQYGTPFTGVPDPRDAVIYQVNMRSFSSTRNFQGVIARLDSIKSLGINLIYLMPIYPVGTLKSVNSPYCIKDYTAVNSEFGTLTDLRMLVDGAHSRGMSVILDWVANHTSWDHAWMSNTAWYAKDTTGNIVSPHGWKDVAQLNFANTDMRNAMIKAMKYWILAANADGYRCDYSDGPPADFWKQAIDTLRNIKTHRLLLLAEGTRSDNFASGFDYAFGFRFFDQMKTIFSADQPVTNLDSISTTEYAGANESNRVVRYTSNHDVNGSDGTPLDLFGGNPGSMAAFVVAAYMNSVPMIYNGQEVGTPYRLKFPFTGNVINWSLNLGMVADYKKIISFRNNSEAIRRGKLTSFSNADVCAFTRISGTQTVFVLSNLRNISTVFNLPSALSNSNWSDAFTGNPVSLTTQLTLAPYSYMVLKK